MNSFSFTIPQNIKVGAGSLSLLPDLAKELGKSKAYIISGPHLNKIGMVAKCQEALMAAGMDSDAFTETEGNPSTDTVAKATEGFKASKADFIVAFGGGSPLDVAKAVAVLATYGGDIVDYEGSGKVKGPIVPMIAIPTTAGTGSEVTAFSVITDHARNYKLTVVSNYLLPTYAILDPELITIVPEKTAAACGIDAMSHPVSAYFDVPHGVANAILLPTVAEFNCTDADPEKYRYIYECIRKDKTGDEEFTPDMLAAEIRVLNHELGIPPTLNEVGVTSDKFEQMADDAMKSGNIQVNPRFTTKNDILKLYELAF